MIGFMSVEAQAEVDFDRARRRAFYGRVAARLRREYSPLWRSTRWWRVTWRTTAAFGPEGRRGLADSWQRGPHRGLRSRLHAHEGEPGGEVEEGGSNVPLRPRFTGSQVVQGGRLLLRRRRRSPCKRRPFPGGGDDRGGRDRGLSALPCTLGAGGVGCCGHRGMRPTTAGQGHKSLPAKCRMPVVEAARYPHIPCLRDEPHANHPFVIEARREG